MQNKISAPTTEKVWLHSPLFEINHFLVFVFLSLEDNFYMVCLTKELSIWTPVDYACIVMTLHTLEMTEP